MTDENKQYDILGQEVKPGSIVMHSDGGHSGQRAFLVKKLSPKMVSLWPNKSFYSNTLIVVDDLVNRMTDDQLIYLITKNGYYSAFVIGGLKDPSEKVCIEAVKKNKDALKVIKDPALQTLIKLITKV